MTSGPDQSSVALLGSTGRKDCFSQASDVYFLDVFSTARQEGCFRVFVSFDLNSRKDALASAMHGESYVAQAARKERTEVSTKQMNSEELT